MDPNEWAVQRYNSIANSIQINRFNGSLSGLGDIDQRNYLGQTLFMHAAMCRFGGIQCMNRLRLYNPDIDAVNNNGNSALIQAVLCDNWRNTRYLLNKGARTDIENENGNTVYDLYQSNEMEKILTKHRLQEQKKMIQVLKESGAALRTTIRTEIKVRQALQKENTRLQQEILGKRKRDGEPEQERLIHCCICDRDSGELTNKLCEDKADAGNNNGAEIEHGDYICRVCLAHPSVKVCPLCRGKKKKEDNIDWLFLKNGLLSESNNKKRKLSS